MMMLLSGSGCGLFACTTLCFALHQPSTAARGSVKGRTRCIYPLQWVAPAVIGYGQKQNSHKKKTPYRSLISITRVGAPPIRQSRIRRIWVGHRKERARDCSPALTVMRFGAVHMLRSGKRCRSVGLIHPRLTSWRT